MKIDSHVMLNDTMKSSLLRIKVEGPAKGDLRMKKLNVCCGR